MASSSYLEIRIRVFLCTRMVLDASSAANVSWIFRFPLMQHMHLVLISQIFPSSPTLENTNKCRGAMTANASHTCSPRLPRSMSSPVTAIDVPSPCLTSRLFPMMVYTIEDLLAPKDIRLSRGMFFTMDE